MKISNVLILVPLMAGALLAQRPWQRIVVPPAGDVAANFKTPPREYGAIQPWIGWNGAHARESIVQDFNRMAANGISSRTSRWRAEGTRRTFRRNTCSL